jgi:hypothetical protein
MLQAVRFSLFGCGLLHLVVASCCTLLHVSVGQSVGRYGWIEQADGGEDQGVKGGRHPAGWRRLDVEADQKRGTLDVQVSDGYAAA